MKYLLSENYIRPVSKYTVATAKSDLKADKDLLVFGIFESIKKNSPASRGVQKSIGSNRMGVSAEGGKDPIEEQVFTCSGLRVKYMHRANQIF